MAKKDTELHVRVNSSDKREAEEILDSMGLSISKVVELCLKQIILKKGVPFSITAADSSVDKTKPSGTENEVSEKSLEAIEEYGNVFC